ncbi:hypothetical protein MHBO_001785 [Bonamia ostreae]|uniref:NF-kappa-B-activating protein C-terminal domain-containing protein n=1 Tax=Bonamia ostreae TaxID=126728 RepID=A0ABV2AL91_9EUKA
MDPALLEKRRLIRLKSAPILPKGLTIWTPSEEIDVDLSSTEDSDAKQIERTNNTKKYAKKRKIAETKIHKNAKNPSEIFSEKLTEKQQVPAKIAKNDDLAAGPKTVESTTEAKLSKRPIGPALPPVSDAKVKGYGSGLYQGEGEAIANFVQKGMRIPRRGEVGLTSKQIEDFESLGYVMSGSRHKRMNAIRIRKENQVYSAEEKKALSVINFEEKTQKEKKVMADMRRFLKSRISAAADAEKKEK